MVAGETPPAHFMLRLRARAGDGSQLKLDENLFKAFKLFCTQGASREPHILSSTAGPRATAATQQAPGPPLCTAGSGVGQAAPIPPLTLEGLWLERPGVGGGLHSPFPCLVLRQTDVEGTAGQCFLLHPGL